MYWGSMDTLELSEQKFVNALLDISSVEEVNLRNQKNIYFGLRSASLHFKMITLLKLRS